MLCRKCPHHVRHGQVEPTTKAISFKDRCALKIKQELDCIHYPFPKVFDYLACEIYRSTFKGAAARNDVVPTKDFEYSESLASASITDMELL
jgi:hypothetical protein